MEVIDLNNLIFYDPHTHIQKLKEGARKKFIEELNGEKGESIEKIIVIPISYEENIDAPGMDGIGMFRGLLRDENGNYLSDKFYFAQGIHPKTIHEMIYSGNYNQSEEKIAEKEHKVINKLRSLCEDPANKVVAIGETGLEFHYDEPYRFKELQKRWHGIQIQLACDLKLPLIMHYRSCSDPEKARDDANEEGIKILQKFDLIENPGVIHCFSGTFEQAKRFAIMGFVIGVGGAFTKGEDNPLKEVIRQMPLEWMVLETDAPYLKPDGYISDYKQNTPFAIPYIAERIAELKGISVEEVAAVTNANTKRVFRL